MTKLTAQAAGTFAIAPTPFHDDGRIDEASIDRLTDFYTEVGCDGVTVLGILGEAPKLDAAEAEQVALRFGQHACVNELQCAMPGQLAADAVELRRRDADRPGVVRDVILFAIVGLQQLLELPEVPGRPAAGLRLRRGRRLGDARDAHQHQRQQRR